MNIQKLSNEEKLKRILDLKDRSIFIYLDVEFIKKNLDHVDFVEFDYDEELGIQGEDANFLIILYSGEIHLTSNLGSGNTARIGEVSTSGRSINLSGLLADPSSWDYNFTATETTECIRLNSDFIKNLKSDLPELITFLRNFTGHYAFRNFKRQLQTSEVQASVILELLQSLRPIEVKKGDVVFHPQQSVEHAVIMETGSLKIEQLRNEELLEVEYLHFPHSFGLDFDDYKENHHYKVTAEEDSSYWSISYEKLRELANDVNLYEFCHQNYEMNLANKVLDDPDHIEFAPSLKDMQRLQKRTIKKYGDTPHTFQHDEMDCSAASLNIICKYFGIDVPLAELREKINVQRDGASMLDIVNVAESIGLTVHAIELHSSDYAQTPYPIIVCLDYHFVVCLKYNSKKGFLLSDPAVGIYWMSEGDFLKSFNDIALIFIPEKDFYENTEKKSSISRYLKLLKTNSSDLIKIGLFSTVLMAVSLIEPIFIQKILDSVLKSEDFYKISMWSLGMVIFGVFHHSVSGMREFLAYNLTLKFREQLSVLFYNKIIKLPYSFHEKHRVGDVIQRISEIEKTSETMAEDLFSIGLDTLLISIYLSYIYYHSWILGLIVTVLGPMIFLYAIFIVKKMNSELNKSFNAFAEMNSIVNEQVKNLDIIKTLNGDMKSKKMWYSSFVKGIRHERSLVKMIIINMSVAQFATYFIYLAILWTGSYLITESYLTAGTLVAITFTIHKLTTPLSQLADKWRRIQEIKVSFEKLDDYFDAEEEKDGASSKDLKMLERIQFSNVSFRYGGEASQDILKEINLEIPKGRKVAIVGKSGSGKSTLAGLLTKLYLPTNGSIFFDDIEINDLSNANLRSNVSIVGQRSRLFTGTILENIAFSDPTPDFERAKKAAILANVHGAIMDQPLGYQTKLLDGGLGLSGGEIQRICIARVIYQNPEVLIIDEATSALDAHNARIVGKNLLKHFSDKTVISITHKIEEVKNFDLIYVMSNGEIVESGKYEDLIKSKGALSDLLNNAA